MVVQTPTSVSMARVTGGVGLVDPPLTDSDAGWTEATDSVRFSRRAMVAGKSEQTVQPSQDTEERVRMNLLRILMETLFRRESGEKETPEEDLIRQVLEEPEADARLDALVRSGTHGFSEVVV